MVLAALALPAFARADVELDPATDTVRVAAELDGSLTRPASGTAASIGLRYVREHRAALGLTAADLETLGDPSVETFAGIRQVRWPQEVDGIEAADAEMRVNVTSDGRVLSVLGSPSSDLPTDTTPRLAKPDPEAELTIYDNRLAYRYEDAVSADEVNDVITDADTGRVLRKVNLVKSVDARVWDLHPSKLVPARVFDIGPWLSSAQRLESQWMRVYSDLNDNNAADAGEDVTPGEYFPAFYDGTGCTDAKPCTWNALNRQTNRQQNAVQAFYLANRFREHVAAAPINFSFGSDQLQLETNDGGGTNNANMYTPPVGRSPRMQMYLWSGTRYRSINSGDDASILFHEYAHGLTGRLVTFPDGVGALSSWQAGAMGEGWSDFYAKDFIVSQGWETDTATPGEIHMGVYSDAVKNSIRSSALDCPAGSAGDCPGYTYGDFADGGPEVHYDGEIWAQTLWDLRRALPAGEALRLVTAALRLSPPEPSFLDMRNAILLADEASGGTRRAAIWTVFAGRGMGFYASTTDGADIAPVEDDSLPPTAGTPVGTLTGTVRDAGGNPVPDATVSIGGVLTAKTNALGEYALADAPVRTYKNVIVTAPGHDRAVLKDVAVPGVANATVRRNWALGATLRSSAGSENADMGCGPKQAFDGLPGSTWSTAQAGGDKELVLQLPQTIDITGFGVDPGAGCGDDERSATAQFQIAVGPSATGPWTVVVPTTTLGAAHRHVMTVFPVTRSDVTYVRMLPMSTQTAGADYIDLSEFAVYGLQSGTRLLTAPPAYARELTSTFTFEGGSSYVCTWDGAAGPCTSPASRALGEGRHTFSVAADGDTTPATHTWTIDRTAPAAAISSATADQDSATFVFASSDASPVTHTCVLDGGTREACTSPKSYAGLSDGAHQLEVTATDAAGNTASASRSVTIDTTAPDTTILRGPAKVTRDDRPAFDFAGGESYECRLDTASFASCPSSYVPSAPLAEGAHSLYVRASRDGRTDPTPAEHHFTVDTQAPVIGMVGASVVERTATFTFAAADATTVGFACTLDGVASSCRSPRTYTGLADGTHTFQVTATDAAGNSASASRTVTVDASPPETIMAWAPPALLTARDFTFAFTASRASTFLCSVDGGPRWPCTSPLALTGLADGPHSLEVTAIDGTGRVDPTPARSDFFVAVSTPPPAATPSPSPAPTASPTPSPRVAALTSVTVPKTVSRKTGKVAVQLRGARGAKVVLQAKAGSRVIGKATVTLSATSRTVTVKLDKRRLKTGARITLRAQASGSGMTSVTRSASFRLKA